ncbi:PREDICTED: glutathione S-transferase theta-2B isoform X1 [Colobus angolensis palliatus]|uniref:glutathione S-transferase theta-2B isoform X1 n=1 Tax=Colobus angolensis palliatus TaxID=336983 RepID=UPI0005F45249|nr:PREDICTED: glutathione S-transferase theta-2B isoform X1 [Colobus angolensis palliatus]
MRFSKCKAEGPAKSQCLRKQTGGDSGEEGLVLGSWRWRVRLEGSPSNAEKPPGPTGGWEQLGVKAWCQCPYSHCPFIPSSAILIYLSCKYQTADHWYPSDLQARARVHEYLGWHADCIRGTFGVPMWVQVLGPLIGVQVPEEKVERNRTAIDQALQWLENKFLGDRLFLAGQQVTLADLMALEELMQPVAVGYELFKGRPRLAAWRERVEAFLGAELCQEARSIILSILEQAAKKTLPTPPPEVYPTMLLRIARIP